MVICFTSWDSEQISRTNGERPVFLFFQQAAERIHIGGQRKIVTQTDLEFAEFNAGVDAQTYIEAFCADVSSFV